MIALNPTGASFSFASIIAIVGSLTFSTLMICTRLVKGTPDIVLVTTQMVGALLFGAVVSPFAWVAMSYGDLALLTLLGVVATFAHFCINRSLKLAPASVVVPYQYTTIVWAVLLSYNADRLKGEAPQAMVDFWNTQKWRKLVILIKKQ